MAQSLRSYFQTYLPNAIVIGDTAYGLNPGDVSDIVEPGGVLSITIPAIDKTIQAKVNQMVEPNQDLQISFVGEDGITYAFEGARKNPHAGDGSPGTESIKK